MIKNNWSVKNEILKRVQKESNVSWATNVVPPAFPEYYPQKPKKGLAGWYNFFKSSIYQLKP